MFSAYVSMEEAWPPMGIEGSSAVATNGELFSAVDLRFVKVVRFVCID
jgi:hypothetical protein